MSDSIATDMRERLRSGPANSMKREAAHKLPDEIRYCFRHEMHLHLAHGLMLVRQGIVDPADMRQILSIVLALLDQGPASADFTNDGEDMYSHVERHIIKQLGPEVGGRLHTGRSRNDLSVTNWRLAMREQLVTVLQRLLDLRRVALEQAGRHADTVMPGYTHYMHAQPITFGYYMLAVADVLGRDYRRLRAALACNDASPLGSAALSTTGFPIDRDWTAQALGFGSLLEVAYDGVSSRDDLLEAASALAVLMVAISRVAVDLENWSTFEYGMVELDDGYCSVSSIMPQKKNPASLEAAKAHAGHVVGLMVAVMTAMKSSSFSDVMDATGYNNQEILEALRLADLTLDMMQGTLATLTVRPERMRRLAAEGFGTATELSDAIVRETGLSFRVAHNIVALVVREKVEQGRLATDITAADVNARVREVCGLDLTIDPERVRAALDPARNVQVRTVRGGPAPDNVRRMTEERQRALLADQTELTAFQARVDAAYRRLEAEARRFVAGRPEAKE